MNMSEDWGWYVDIEENIPQYQEENEEKKD